MDLATGKKMVEEWSILPTDVQFFSIESIMFDKNFFLLNIGGENDVLVLNLQTQKKFWIQKSILENQIREQLPNVDEEGEPFDINSFRVTGANFKRMNTEVNSIKIVYRMELDNGGISLG